ncbi:MAG: AmmeMemoRadiSam system protein B [Bacteroidales bacterium]
MKVFRIFVSMGQNNKPERFARPPAVAGRFYPGSEKDLRKEVEQLFRQAQPPAGGDVRALISPHAGYVFSGGVAASAFNQLDRNRRYRRIFLIGSSHRVPIQGAAVYTEGDYRTPMGTVKVDTELGKQLAMSHPGLFTANSHAHAGEHSLEVQLPFLQHLYANNILLVPLVIGTFSPHVCKEIAQALAPWFNRENLFVISTDFSHYPPYDQAVRVDALTKDAILTNNPQALMDTLRENEANYIPGLDTSLCGWTSVLTLMYLTSGTAAASANNTSSATAPAQGLDPSANAHERFTYHALEYKNSGDNPLYGEKDQVVGYWAFSVTAKEAGFSQKAEAMLQALAKEAVHAAVTPSAGQANGAGKNPSSYRVEGAKGYAGSPLAETSPADYPPELHKPYGAFVTLKQQGCLRGCIGRIESDIPLYLLVQEMARAAALYDNRFPPVSVTDLPHLTYEITVLSPLREIQSIDEIELGKHGIIIQDKGRTGVFLPQVAVETGWSLEEFLGHCSRDKAGLGWDGWKKARIFIFHALNEE